jgi:hypothetical protein
MILTGRFIRHLARTDVLAIVARTAHALQHQPHARRIAGQHARATTTALQLSATITAAETHYTPGMMF